MHLHVTAAKAGGDSVDRWRARKGEAAERVHTANGRKQAAVLAGLGAGSMRDRGFMCLYAWMRNAACRKHSRRWPAASTALLAAGSPRQGEVPSMSQKAHYLRQCGSSFFLVVAGWLS